MTKRTEDPLDTAFIKQSAPATAPHIQPGATVVLESRTCPGTTGELLDSKWYQHPYAEPASACDVIEGARARPCESGDRP